MPQAVFPISSALIFPLALLLAAIGSALLARYARLFGLVDVPNERSLHTAPIPRAGGLALWASCLACALLLAPTLEIGREVGWGAVAAALVLIISLVDDRVSLSARVRLVVQLAAAVLLLMAGPMPSAVSVPGFLQELPTSMLLVLGLPFIIWMTNLYNFMDGMDGFAGGMAVIGFGALGLAGTMAGAESFSAIAFLIAAASAGFLVFNFPPARIFMGDAGSSTLGFMAAFLCLWAERDGILPLWLGLLVFSPFIVDATVTLLRRLLAGERVWEAHKTHYYQRLVQIGWGHRKTVLWEYALMLCAAGSALLLSQADARVQWAGMVAWALIYLGLARLVARLEHRYHEQN